MSGDGSLEPHSAVFFGPIRDYWWNFDQLELCARRIGLDDRVRTVLDVGAGVGHWGRLVQHLLSPEATLVGIDREPQWVEEATRNAAAEGLADRFSYTQASAEDLPFEDASFDLVTCQTLLIHVADPRAVIREMLRVTKPGGLLLVSEPNNRALTLLDSSVTAGSGVEERLDYVRFYLTCEQGKIALGEGDNSVGDLVPMMFADEGLEDVQAYTADKVAFVYPPYEDEEMQAHRQSLVDDAERGACGWSRDEARRYYRAGGGDSASFDATWERRVAEVHAMRDAAVAGSFRSSAGDVLYLVSGRRPLS